MSRDIDLGNPAVHPDEDEFNRWPFSRALADRVVALGSTEGAPVVGLYGKWGYGKSSVLNFIKHHLEQEHAGKVVLFEFNPWFFTSQEELLAAFFADLAARLEQSLGSVGGDVDKNSDGSDLFSAWYVNGLTNLRQWLEQRLVKDPGLGMLLLRLILPDSSSTAAQVNYSFIAEVVTPAVLATALSTHLGSKLGEIDDGSPDILFARSFLDEYKRHHSTSEAANGVWRSQIRFH
jgi:hypothetical protein